MRLYLVQHGEAASKEEDPQRPLTEAGAAASRLAAARLAAALSPVGGIRHSGLLRAEQTASIFAAALGIASVSASRGLAPSDDPAVFAGILAAEPAESSLLVVGHLPQLARLAGLLLAGDAAREPVRFRNAGVVCLERGQGPWRLEWAVVPDLLAAADR
jgi:phosphohistidine phosphatase